MGRFSVLIIAPPALGTSLQPLTSRSPAVEKIAAPVCRERSLDLNEADFTAYMPNSSLHGAISAFPKRASINLVIPIFISARAIPSMKTSEKWNVSRSCYPRFSPISLASRSIRRRTLCTILKIFACVGSGAFISFESRRLRFDSGASRYLSVKIA